MDSLTKAWFNFGTEAVMVLVLVLLLVTCLLQKKRFASTRPLIILTSVNIVLLLEQLVSWWLFTQNSIATLGLLPNRIIYALDYALYYAVAASFYFYINAHLKDLYQDKGLDYSPKKIQNKLVIGWGVVISVIFTVLMFDERFYYLKDGAEWFNEGAYLVMFLLGTFAVVNSVVVIIRQRIILGRTERILLIGYVVIPNSLAITDLLNGLATSYILMSLFVFILYIYIDLRRGSLIEEKDRALTDLQTQIMLSQMQPHFLYNVLTTISGLCDMEDAIEARDVTDRFADYFRTNLDSLGKEKFISFEKELEHVKTYLWLEKIRFEDTLQVKYDIQATDFMIPSLAVQPIVENAVKHGLRRKKGVGTVTIKTYETPIDHLIIIEDDGVGFDEQEKLNENRSHVGLKNVEARLKLLCDGGINVRSEKGRGTVVTIHIPKGGNHERNSSR